MKTFVLSFISDLWLGGRYRGSSWFGKRGAVDPMRTWSATQGDGDRLAFGADRIKFGSDYVTF